MVSCAICRKSYPDTPWRCVKCGRYYHTSCLDNFITKYPEACCASIRSEPSSSIDAVTNACASVRRAIRSSARAERFDSGRVSLDPEEGSLVGLFSPPDDDKQENMADQSPMSIESFSELSDSDRLVALYTFMTTSNRALHEELASQKNRLDRTAREIERLKAMHYNAGPTYELKLCGIPITSSLSHLKLAEGVLKYLDLQKYVEKIIKTRDLQSRSRTKNQGTQPQAGTKTVVVKFESVAIRDYILEKKRNKGRICYKDVFPGADQDNEIGIFAMDSEYTFKLKRAAKDLANRHGYARVWVSSGTPQSTTATDAAGTSEPLRVAYANVNSLRAHLVEIKSFLSNHYIDVLSICETWLTPKVPDSLVHIPGFYLKRNDRGLTTEDAALEDQEDQDSLAEADGRRYRFGGGVACCLRSTIKSRIIAAPQIEEIDETESLLLELKTASGDKILFGSVYRRPEGHRLTKFFQELQDVLPLYHSVIVTGDFNYNLRRGHGFDGQHLLRMISECSLACVPHDATNHTATSDTQIDEILVDSADRIVSYWQTEVPFINGHDLLTLDYRFPMPPDSRVTPCRDFRHLVIGDFNTALMQRLTLVLTRVLDDADDVESLLNAFNGEILAVLDEQAPVAPRTKRRYREPWITPDLCTKRRERDRLYKEARRTRCPVLLSEFRLLRTTES
ncbi:hypothetical protein TKK_0014278 [Trichogramma kaykai]